MYWKKLLLILIASVLLVYPSRVLAAITPTPSISPSAADEKLNKDLQERIASEVAQKNLVEKKGFIGKVTSVTETQISITDLNGNSQIIDVDELTNFSSPASKSFGISDVTRNMTIGVVGLFYKDSKHLLARWVDVVNSPTILSGGILSVDKTNFVFTMATENTDSVTIDVENISKTTSYTAAGGVVKSGFSHILAGQRVLVVGFPDTNNKNEIIASRIILFPDIPVNPRIPMVNPTDVIPVTPSTGSGKTLTPIR